MRRPGSVVLVVLMLCLASGVAIAGSPSPAASPVPPGASPAADCSDLAASIPERVGAGLVLQAAPTQGVEGIDPDDLLDPLLRSLGRGRPDVCGVTLRIADPARAGMLLRIRDGGPDLAATVAAALAERLRGYGQVVAEDTLQVGEVPVARLLVGPAASATALLVATTAADVVLLTDSTELAEVVLAALPRPSPIAPWPSPASPVPSTDG